MTTLFGAGTLPRTLRSRALAMPVSAVVHGSALVLLVVISVASPGELPPPAARPPLPPVPTIATPPPRVIHVRPVGGGRALQPPRSSRTLGAKHAVTPVPLRPPEDLPAESAPSIDGTLVVGAAEETCCGPSGLGDGPAGDLAGMGGDGPGTGAPYRVGGDIREPLKVRHVAPVYPDTALRAGVGGAVEIECVIDAEGGVVDVRVVRGHPLLETAAVEAVRQWRYRPTLLNGVPVPVRMTVVVRFTAVRR